MKLTALAIQVTNIQFQVQGWEKARVKLEKSGSAGLIGKNRVLMGFIG